MIHYKKDKEIVRKDDRRTEIKRLYREELSKDIDKGE
jgi:hypothetical protein